MPEHAYSPAVLPITAITVGHRYRRDLGDLSGLISSIRGIGLLNPPVVSSDGVLLCGARRLAAVQQLGWSQVEVRVATDASGTLTAVLAEQHENELRLDLSPVEQATLYAELKEVYAEDARRRQESSRFGGAGVLEGGDGGGDSPPPWGESGKSRDKAALAVTGKESYKRLDQITKVQAVVDDPELPLTVRRLAEEILDEINAGGSVDPLYRKVMTAVQLATATPPAPPARKEASEEEIAELSRQALATAQARRAEEIQAAAARRLAASTAVRNPMTVVLTWKPFEGWPRHYDVEQVARSVPQKDWEFVCRVHEDIDRWIDAVNEARAALGGDETTEAV